jgi:PAS domain S-box-containing protein
VAGDTNGALDVFVRDRTGGRTQRVSVSSKAKQANGSSTGPAIIGDGRLVAFASSATNLVVGDTNGSSDIFVHDRVTGDTTRVSVAADGTQGDRLTQPDGAASARGAAGHLCVAAAGERQSGGCQASAISGAGRFEFAHEVGFVSNALLRNARCRAAEQAGHREWTGRGVPAMGAEAWFGGLVGGIREPPFEPIEEPQVGDLLHGVVTSAGRLVGAPDVVLYLVEPNEHGDQRLVVRYATGCFLSSLGRSAGVGQGLAGEVWRTGAPLVVDEYQTWPRRLRGDRAETGVRGALATPVRSHGEVVGVLGVASKEPGRAFGDAEIEALDRFGELAGMAIDDARQLAAGRRDLAELAQSEARYRTLFEELPALVYTEAYAVGGSWLYESPGVKDIMGYTPEESGQPGFWKKILHPDDRERVLAEDRRVELTGDPWRMEYRSIAKDGRVVWLRDHAVLVRGKPGQPSFWHGFVIDITEQKVAEQAMREALERERQATNRLRALDEAKNVFLNAVSHELRTPLAAIVGIALTLKRAGSSLAEEDGADLVDRLAANASKLDRLLSDLLDLDRLNRGIVTPQLRHTDLAALVARIATEWETARPLELAVEPVVAQVDSAKVERIVENLLANADRHTTPDTPVWVRLARQNQGVLIAVEDAGGGVPPELRAALFEPFRQGPEAAAHAPGVGIGLTLVARFSELHGGRAWVEERPGGGSSFRVLLPDPPAASSSTASAPERFSE